VGDGTDPTVVPDDVLAEELSAEELAEIDVLRDAIEQGIGVGDEEYIEKVTLSLQTAGVLDDYESAIGEGWSNVEEAVSTCPFAEYYNNGFQPNGVNCDFLVELAQLDAYAALTEALDDSELPTDVQDGPYSEEANFWYEQGAVSGIEQRRVLVRADLREQAMCSTKPTPNEGAFDKGYTVGGQAMADAFNDWLAENGHVADYPTMATPIEVCNVNASVLDPAYQNAKDVLPTLLETMPLCEDYVAPTQQHALEYAQAMIQYEAGVEAGMDAEYSLAAVRIFREIPCNVSDPIVLDLDGDGLELLPVHRGVNFDFYDVGREQAVAWVGPDDALLVLDRNADGMITNGGELFGNIDQNYADGFAQMAELDANGDGVLSADDPAWASLAAWRDINTDGQSQAGELLSMDDIGLTAIPVSGVRVTMRSGGNRIPWVATAVGTSGDMLVGDALLRTAPWASPSF